MTYLFLSTIFTLGGYNLIQSKIVFFSYKCHVSQSTELGIIFINGRSRGRVINIMSHIPGQL